MGNFFKRSWKTIAAILASPAVTTLANVALSHSTAVQVPLTVASIFVPAIPVAVGILAALHTTAPKDEPAVAACASTVEVKK